MNRLAFALACILALPACERPNEAPAPPPEIAATTTAMEMAPLDAPPPQLENNNLLNLVFGAGVIERNIERSYEQSAAHAIDGTSMSSWASEVHEPLAGIFFLAAPTRLTRLGITAPTVIRHPSANLRIETSLDGKSWARTLDQTFALDKAEPRLFDIPPTDALYLRVTFEAAAELPNIESLYAIGSELAPVVQPPIEGCWEINYEPARFVRSGARVTGTIGSMVVDGGTDGRFYRLMWLDKNMFGYAAVTVSPDGNHLSGVRWHESVNPAHGGDGWIGHRVACRANDTIDHVKIVDSIVKRAGVWRLYGIRFDRTDHIIGVESASALDLAARLIREQRFRLVAREFRAAGEAKNRERCAAKLAAVREELAARGVDVSRLESVIGGTDRGGSADFTSLRAMNAGVELQVVPPR